MPSITELKQIVGSQDSSANKKNKIIITKNRKAVGNSHSMTKFSARDNDSLPSVSRNAGYSSMAYNNSNNLNNEPSVRQRNKPIANS